MSYRVIAPVLATVLAVAGGCAPQAIYGNTGVTPQYAFPVTYNGTPYSTCLDQLSTLQVGNRPVVAVGEIADKTGQINYDENGNALTQGVAEMMSSALYRTGITDMVERYDLRVPLAEIALSERGLLDRPFGSYQGNIPGTDFIVLGALTELNYNITSDGLGLWVAGIGGSARTVVINVAIDARLVESSTFRVVYARSLQKQIYGYEVEADVFRFFGSTLVEFQGGSIRNEPLQIGVRSVVEMFVYNMLTEGLGLPGASGCELIDLEYPFEVVTAGYGGDGSAAPTSGGSGSGAPGGGAAPASNSGGSSGGASGGAGEFGPK